MQSEDSHPVIQYHESRIRQYGAASSLALGWNTNYSQKIRFKVLAGIADLSHRSVLDNGCGKGDLSAFLGKCFTGIRYTGIDQMAVFIEMANKLYGHLPGTRFIQCDFDETDLPLSDYVLVSGALNYKNSDKDYIYKTITRLFNASEKGLAFNLLSATGYPEGELCSYQPDNIIKFCRSLSDEVKWRDDYLEGDYTIFMHKNAGN